VSQLRKLNAGNFARELQATCGVLE